MMDINYQTIGNECQTKQEAADNKRKQIQDCDDPVIGAVKRHTTQLHQLAQMKENAVHFDNECNDRVADVAAFQKVIHKNAQNLHTRTQISACLV